MASLSGLPTETLLHILGFVGPDFFADDISRLAVSRRWLECAWRVLDGNLRLKTANDLVEFTANPAVLAHSQPSIVSVNPSLPLLEDAPDQPLPNDEA